MVEIRWTNTGCRRSRKNEAVTVWNGRGDFEGTTCLELREAVEAGFDVAGNSRLYVDSIRGRTADGTPERVCS